MTARATPVSSSGSDGQRGVRDGEVAQPVDEQRPPAREQQQTHDDEHDAAEHAADSAALKQAFGGASVDLFFEPGEVDGGKPGLSGLKFLDHVDVTGKELLRFEKAAGETYLIDPDTVFVYRARKGK